MRLYIIVSINNIRSIYYSGPGLDVTTILTSYENMRSSHMKVIPVQTVYLIFGLVFCKMTSKR